MTTTLNQEQKVLVQRSWAQVKPIREAAAAMFYARLFERNPELESYFTGDMREQGKMLMSVLNNAVNGLDDLDALVAPVQRLGKAHLDYGVKAQDYDKVGAALLWTLEQGLGPAFSPEVKAAWANTYALLAEVMKEGAGYSDCDGGSDTQSAA